MGTPHLQPVRNRGNNLDLHLASEVRACGTGPLRCGIKCYLQVGRVRIELTLWDIWLVSTENWVNCLVVCQRKTRWKRCQNWCHRIGSVIHVNGFDIFPLNVLIFLERLLIFVLHFDILSNYMLFNKAIVYRRKTSLGSRLDSV